MEYSLRMIVLCWSIYCNGDIEVASSWSLAYKCNLSQLYADSSFASSYNHEWWPFLSSWIVQLPLSLLLIGLSKGICSSTPSLERLIKELFDFPLRLQSMYSLARTVARWWTRQLQCRTGTVCSMKPPSSGGVPGLMPVECLSPMKSRQPTLSVGHVSSTLSCTWRHPSGWW